MRPVNEIRCYIVTLPLISWAHKQNDPWTWSFLCRKRFPRPRLQRKPLVSDPGMYHGTCVTHVSWYMPESLTRGGRENVPGIHDACTTRNFAYLVRGQCTVLDLKLTMSYFINMTLNTFPLIWLCNSMHACVVMHVGIANPPWQDKRNFAYRVRGQCTALDSKLTMSYFNYEWLWIHFRWSDSVIQKGWRDFVLTRFMTISLPLSAIFSATIGALHLCSRITPCFF